MAHYVFEWDANKSRTNEKKHGVSFDEAKTVFLDRYALESFDFDHSSDEDRFAMIGRSDQERVLVIAYTVRDGKTIRIISARIAQPQERFQYEK